MNNLIPYETIAACKMGSEEALSAILRHYEPLILEASRRNIPRPDGTFESIIDEDIKAHIQSELAMKILLKYDLTRKPRKNPSHDNSENAIGMTG